MVYTKLYLTVYDSIYYLHVKQILVLCALMDLLDILRLLLGFRPLFLTLWVRMEDYHWVVHCEVGSISEELLLGQGRGFFFYI
jgi:hypothetical protein